MLMEDVVARSLVQIPFVGVMAWIVIRMMDRFTELGVVIATSLDKMDAAIDAAADRQVDAMDRLTQSMTKVEIELARRRS